MTSIQDFMGSIAQFNNAHASREFAEYTFEDEEVWRF